jgi:tetratricopeptide (TPR) repeat protein
MVSIRRVDPQTAAIEHAQTLCGIGRYAEALAAVQRSLASYPDSGPLWSQSAICRGGLGSYADALADAERAIVVDPDRETGYRLRSIYLSHLRRYREAVEPARTAARLAPESIAALSTLVRALVLTRQHAEAEQVLQTMLSLQPDALLTHEALMLAAACRKDWPTAEARCITARALFPEWHTPRTNLGIVCYNTRRHQEAVDHLREALRLKSDDSYTQQRLLDVIRSIRLPVMLRQALICVCIGATQIASFVLPSYGNWLWAVTVLYLGLSIATGRAILMRCVVPLPQKLIDWARDKEPKTLLEWVMEQDRQALEQRAAAKRRRP